MTPNDRATRASDAPQPSRPRAFLLWLRDSDGHAEKLRFLAAGVWNTVFGYGVFALLWALFGTTWPYWLVLGVSYAIATVMAFATQKFLVFRSSGSIWREFPRFVLVYGASLIANLVVFPVLVRSLHINPYLAQALFLAAQVIVTYTVNKYFSFRQVR